MTRLFAWLLVVTILAGCNPEPPALPPLEGLTPDSRTMLEQHHSRADADPTAENLGMLGLAFFAFDFPTEAAASLEMAADRDPDDARWPYYRGVLARSLGDLEVAANWLRQALEDDPDDQLTRTRLGEAQLELGLREEAAVNLEGAIAADSNLTLAHFLLGELRLEEGAHEAAVEHLFKAAQLQPQATQIRAPLSAALSAVGEAEASAFHRARRGDRPVTIRDARTAVLDSMRLISGATRVLEAERLMQRGAYDQAETILEVEVDQNPESADAWMKLGIARAGLGSRAGALLALREAIARDSLLELAHYNLGVIALSVQDTASAEAALRRAVSLGGARTSAQEELARILRRTGRCAEALPHLEAAVAWDPTSSVLRLDQVLCLNQVGQDSLAVTILEEAVRTFPNHLGYVDALARITATSADTTVRDGDAALGHAETAVEIQQRTETLETVALALAEVGRRADALRVLDQAISQAERGGDARYQDHLRAIRGHIRRGTPVTEAWPAFVYTR